MKNFVQEGCFVDVKLPYARTSGQGVLKGKLFGVCMVDGAQDAVISIATEGVFDITAASGTATQGDPAYWDDTNKRVASTAGTNDVNKLIGNYLADKATNDATARVRLFC